MLAWNFRWKPNFPPFCSKGGHDFPLFPAPERCKHNELALCPLLNVLKSARACLMPNTDLRRHMALSSSSRMILQARMLTNHEGLYMLA